MTLYFGHSDPITDPFDIETEWMIKNKAPLIRSKILEQRIRIKKWTLKNLLAQEINKRIRDEKNAT